MSKENGIASKLVPKKEAITGGWSSGVDLISSIVAGLLIGLGVDWLFGTQPVFAIIMGLAGFGSGSMKLWKYSEILERQAEARRRGR
jgi:ATP synthase protein I